MSKKICTIIITIVIIMGILNYSEASSFRLIARADETEVIPGQEVTISLNLSDIDMGEHGINVVEGYLKYEDSFFSAMEMVDKNDWKVTYNNKNGKFLTSKIIEEIKEEQEILLIKLKVRDDLKEGETEVKLQEITSNDGVNLVSDGNKSIKIKIKGNNSKDNSENNSENNKESNQNTNEEDEKQINKEEQNIMRQNVRTGDTIAYIVGAVAIIIGINLAILKLKTRKE